MKTLVGRFLLVAVIGLLCNTAIARAGEGWLTNYQEALAKAKLENKNVMLDFTGSDWCGWCIKLNKEVFSTSSFKSYADKHLVLVEIDFPKSKPQTSEVKKQNQELQEQFGIQGYPTIIIVNPEGKKIGQLGYMPGGPTVFIRELRKIK